MALKIQASAIVLAVAAISALPIRAQQPRPRTVLPGQSARAVTNEPGVQVVPNDSGINLVGSVSASWGSSGVRMQVARIVNTSGSDSQPLLLHLWATTTAPVYGTTIHADNLGSYSLGVLQNGFEFDNVDSGEVSYTPPPAGCYYVAVALVSLKNGGPDATYWSFRTLPDGGPPALFSFGGTACGGSSPGQAGVLYGVENSQSGSELFRIDNFATNPQITNIGNTGLDQPAIAIDPTSGNLYAIEPTTGYLYLLDAQSGASQFIADTGLASSGLVALACNPQGGLFAWGRLDSKLYRLDPSSGAATLIGYTGYAAGGDLAFGLDGSLYGSTGTDLIRIDAQTGGATYIGSFQTENIFGLAVAADGTLYAGQDSSGFFSEAGQLYRVNTSNAQLTPVGGPISISIADLALFGGAGGTRPNLKPFTPPGWSAPVVVSTTPGTQVDSPTLTTADTLYASWAVLNNGNAPTAVTFYTSLYLDGALLQRWHTDPPLGVNFYAYIKDYQFGPLSENTHTLELVADDTAVIGPSQTFSKTLSVGPASCGQRADAGQAGACRLKLRLVATSLNILSTNPAPTRIQRIDLGSAASLEFAVGEGFRLRVVQLNADGSEGPAVTSNYTTANAIVATPPVTTTLATTPITFFKGVVLLPFSAEPTKLLPVHSGSIVLNVSTSSGQFTVPVQVVASGYSLGSTHPTDMQGEDIDKPILGFADLHGIPPQIVKAVVRQEASAAFDATSYRYEPLALDFRQFSTGPDKRKNSTFANFIVQTVPDSLDSNGFAEGGEIDSTDRALRERLKVTLGSDGKPLAMMLQPAGRGANPRNVLPSDSPIPMENILFTGNGYYNWYTSKVPSTVQDEMAYLAFRRHNHKPFTAQTVLAASFGLMQVTPGTASGYGYTTGGSVRQPSDLFDATTCIDIGSNVLAGVSQTLPVPSTFAHPGDLRKAWAEAVSFYQGAKRSYVIQNGPTDYGKSVIAFSDLYFPLQ
jgi:hypothetical protein